MSEDVNPRRYNNAGRARKADQTRREIVAAARDLFLADGYPSTTLAGIASRAGVSVQTVYGQFGSKRAILKQVLDHAAAGDDAPVPVNERPWVQQILTEPDPARKLQLNARGVADIMRRACPLDVMLRSAALVDAEANELWQISARQRVEGMRQLADHLAHTGHLRAGLTVADATDRLAVLTDPELYRLTVLERAWTHEQYEAWLTDLSVTSVVQTVSH